MRQTGLNSNGNLFLALSGFEVYGTFCPQSEPVPIPAAAGMFPYADESSTGIVEFLAMADGVDPYRNPAGLGRMAVSASSLINDSQPASAAVGYQAVRCVTRPIPDSWFTFDFLNLWIAPTHYRLRHYSSWDTEALRDWVFEGSNDGTTWVVLDMRIGDGTLDQKGKFATFACNTPAGQSFRLFRVRQTGRNSNNHFYLALSGFEIFGEAFTANLKPSAEPPAVTSFTHTAPFDGNDLVHYLATNGGAGAYVNPVATGLARVTSSAMMHDSEPATAVLGNSAVRCVTRPVSDSWIAI